MTAEIINLRRARKVRKRADRRQQAEENRVRHGRSRAERERDDAAREIEQRRVESHRRVHKTVRDEPGSE